MNKILVIDNYDSFTYNLVHVLQELGEKDISVIRNDKLSVEDAAKFKKIILSPGPGIPEEAGIMPSLLKSLCSTHSILGVCLGHQAIGECYGAKLKNLSAPVHGKGTPFLLKDTQDKFFEGIPSGITVGRYHSWVVDRTTLPDSLIVTGEDDCGEIMSMRHTQHKVYGVQFHPESVMTEHGQKMIKNFLSFF